MAESKKTRSEGFRIVQLPNSKDHSFDDLLNAQEMEDFSHGRKVAIVADVRAGEGMIPIVRTTSPHTKPTQPFTDTHRSLLKSISVDCNNAMIEVYESQYTKMGFHSDQALDLADDSWICLYSSYEQGRATTPRRLVTKEKTSGRVSEIVLAHNSVVMFSTDTNRRYLHKIVGSPHACGGRWLGVTLRKSKTFVQRQDGHTFFAPPASATDLTMATPEQRREFCRLKSLENKLTEFRYPAITYTLSCH